MRKYIRIGRGYFLEEVFDLLLKPALHTSEKIRKELDDDLVCINSFRLCSFKHNGTICKHCGIVGDLFYKEKRHNNKYYHLNLYGTNDKGEEILMTHDHIIPKSKGGPEYDMNNIQTLCTYCNLKKGNKLLKEVSYAGL